MSSHAAKCFSRGIKKLSLLDVFFPELHITNRKITSVIGWGFKSTALKARNYATKHHLTYIALEDGFLRSMGLGVQGATPLSLVIDEVGIYYDARQPSKLENLILDSNGVSSCELERSQSCIAAIRQYRLSKYNQSKSDNELTSSKPKIVVVDQTKGDASVVGAMADEQTFINMLTRAIENHPNDVIWVKVHPDVVCGKKQGFLYPLPFEHPNIRIYSGSCNPWDFLESTEKLYTVSSLMGFEALMAGVNVHCFGVPFYAGWGLTEDEIKIERRGETRSLDQIFYAAYIQYARYVDPILGKRCEIEDTITYLVDSLRYLANESLSANVSSLSLWKLRWIDDYLKVWNVNQVSSSKYSLAWGRHSDDTHTYSIEDGFIRSIGLGVNFNRPISLVLDKLGIYFDSTCISDLESMLQNSNCSRWDLIRAKKVIDKLVASNLTKYNVGCNKSLNLPADQKIILVPGQVEGDASIKYGSPEIQTNAELLVRVRKSEPKAFIIYKPHPDVVADQRDDGNWEGEFTQNADLIETDISMASLLDVIDEVHTMTSLTGFEALLRDKKVTTYGVPFYSCWGLTTDKVICERRSSRHTIESLVFFALIQYSTYVDSVTRSAITVEQAIERLSQMKAGGIEVKDHKLRALIALRNIKRNIIKVLDKTKNT